MRKKLLCIFLCLPLGLNAGCGSNTTQQTTAVETSSTEVETQESVAPTKVVNFTFDIPDGFVKDETSENTWYADDSSGSSINYTVSAYYDEINNYTEDTYKAELEEQFSANDYDFDLNIEQFEKTEFDGYPGYKIKLSYDYGYLHITQVNLVIITPDLIGSVILNDINNSGWLEKFEATESSLKAVIE